MSDPKGEPEPAAAGRVYFDLWSWMHPDTQTPPGGVPPAVGAAYRWEEKLCDEHPPPDGPAVGNATLGGTRQADGMLHVSGTITISEGASPWKGTVSVAGPLAITAAGQVGNGDLNVISTSNVPFTRVTVIRENPKRYIAQG